MVYHKGYNSFTEKPDQVQELLCKVCGTICVVERSVHGPTGYIQAMSRRGSWHDAFKCPNSTKNWHYRALNILLEMEKTSSRRIAELMWLDMKEILEKHNCKLDPPPTQRFDQEEAYSNFMDSLD